MSPSTATEQEEEEAVEAEDDEDEEEEERVLKFDPAARTPVGRLSRSVARSVRRLNHGLGFFKQSHFYIARRAQSRQINQFRVDLFEIAKPNSVKNDASGSVVGRPRTPRRCRHRRICCQTFLCRRLFSSRCEPAAWTSDKQ